MKIPTPVIYLLLPLMGFIAGAYLYQDSRPRSFAQLPDCESCWHPNEIIGMAAAIGIKNLPGWIPEVVLETDSAIAIKHPFPAARIHFVVFPKKDIKNLGDLGREGLPAATECLTAVNQLIRENHLSNYRVWSNGPDNQIVAYLHFHLAGS